MSSYDFTIQINSPPMLTYYFKIPTIYQYFITFNTTDMKYMIHNNFFPLQLQLRG